MNKGNEREREGGEGERKGKKRTVQTTIKALF